MSEMAQWIQECDRLRGEVGRLQELIAGRYQIGGKSEYDYINEIERLNSMIESFDERGITDMQETIREQAGEIERLKDGVDPPLRALLRHWAMWWDGPGRELYRGNVTPPLKATREVLKCSVCQGIDLMQEGEHCRACGRNSPIEEPTP